MLIRRVLQDHNIHHVQVRLGLRVPRDKLVKPGEVERYVQYARQQAGAQAITVIIDADNDCPKTLGPQLLARSTPVAPGYHLSVVLAKIELEAWFIAGIESLRGTRGIRPDAAPPQDPENIRDAKGWLTSQMLLGRTYIPVDDQASFAQALDYTAAATRSRSLRKFINDIRQIGAAL
ncbi:MAG: DUF4276 family protein [Candidatus Rokubacteria bacterium]|nr:DUF4276 family protein [Candidatus Rokubacteria bacterium]